MSNELKFSIGLIAAATSLSLFNSAVATPALNSQCSVDLKEAQSIMSYYAGGLPNMLPFYLDVKSEPTTQDPFYFMSGIYKFGSSYDRIFTGYVNCNTGDVSGFFRYPYDGGGVAQ